MKNNCDLVFSTLRETCFKYFIFAAVRLINNANLAHPLPVKEFSYVILYKLSSRKISSWLEILHHILNELLQHFIIMLLRNLFMCNNSVLPEFTHPKYFKLLVTKCNFTPTQAFTLGRNTLRYCCEQSNKVKNPLKSCIFTLLFTSYAE